MQSIIIVGAGAAGLMAAKELSGRYKVIILEGNIRLGGRIHTVQGGGFTQPVEAGAEFIHGNLPLTLQLLKEAGAAITETGGEMASWRDGQWVERDVMPGGWAKMMQRMHELEKDATLESFLQANFAGNKYAKLCERARGYAQGYDVADPAKVSVFFLRDEWGGGWEEQHRITGGYGKLVEYLAAECLKGGGEIYTGETVKRIKWGKNQVTAITAAGKEYCANKVIITVPAPILHNAGAAAHIQFLPALPEYTSAAASIGYGGVIKVVLEFKTAFWNEAKPGLGFMFCGEFIPTWWTQAPDEAPVITGWLGGPPADILIDTPDSEILQNALRGLANVFGFAVEDLHKQLVAGSVYNWPANTFSLGAYSYATPLTGAALKVLNTPVEGTLYFAGEALYSGQHPGTVEAALVSGKEVAEKIK